MDHLETMIDEIYEAAVLPDRWPLVLANLSRIPGAAGGALFATDMRRTNWIASDGIRAAFERFIREGWMARNPRPVRLAALRHAGFVTDEDTFTPAELEVEPVYVEFLRKVGVGWAAGTTFPMPSGDNIVFTFERAFDLGPVPRPAVALLDQLRPHLGRASLLAWRLGLRRAQAMAEALQAVGMPAAVLRGAGRLQASNLSFDELVPAVLQDRRDRLTLVDTHADALLADALARLSVGATAPGVQSIPVPGGDQSLPMVVHLLPVKRGAHDIFSQASTIVVVMPVDKAHVPSAQILEGLFDLTPAEARIARAIAEGEAVADIAARASLSVETVRSHLKSTLSKTGLNRQAELAALLAGVNLPRDAPSRSG